MLLFWWSSSRNFVSAFAGGVLKRITSWNIRLLSVVRVTFVLPAAGSMVSREIIWVGSRSFLALEGSACRD